MKTKIMSALVLGFAISAYADSTNSMVVSPLTAINASTGSGQVMQVGTVTSQNTNAFMANNAVNMSLLALPNQSPKVVINLTTIGYLTVYDQNGKIALTSNLPAGQVTIDSNNFPLGNDRLVVTTNQNGSTFTMVQNIIVYPSNADSVSGS